MKFKYITLSLLTAATMTACNESDFLETIPQGVLSEGVLQSSEGADLLVNAAYAALGGPNAQEWSSCFYPATNWSYGDVRADNAYKGGGGMGDVSEIHQMEIFATDAANFNVDNKWYHMYTCVKRCNAALALLNQCSDAEVDSRSIRIAEVKVLRAHYYFELSRLFNKIVWIEEDVVENDYATIPNDQFTRDEILGKIAADLEAAASVLPATQKEIGRVNKYIAKAYLAKVNLYRAYQQDETTHKVTGMNSTYLNNVVSLCDELINSGRYGLLDDFQQLDLVAYENGSESVWAIQFSMYDGSASAGRINWSHLLNTPQGPYSGDGFFLPSQNLVNAYKTDANGLPLLDGSFADEDFDNFADDVYTMSDCTVDPRLDFVVGRPNIRWKTYEESTCKNTWVRDQGTYGFHCSKRFCVSPESPDMFQGWPWGASQLNWQIIRFADILLWKAEALIELDRADEARPLINQIRERAKNSAYVTAWEAAADDATVYPDFDGFAANYKIELYPAENWTKEYARKALQFETRLEKAMEGERFFDLVRWGIAEETMNAYIAHEKGKRVYYNGASFTSGRDEYLPITNQQYKFSNNTYVQNPGYGSF